MKIRQLLPLFFVLCYGMAFSQEEDKLRLQQQFLLSRERQAEIAREEADKLRYEKQEKQLAEQEKQLLKMSVTQKETELQEESIRAETNRIQAQYQAALKDERIQSQQTDIQQNRRWMIYLISISVVILLAAVIIYLSHRRTRRLNELIIRQHDELSQVSHVKDRLLTIVGHDMRSPLSMLLGLSQILRHEDIPKHKMDAYMTQLESTLIHTSSMMNNLLYWAASQMQGYRPDIQEVNICEVASNVLLLQEARAIDKGISIHNKVSPELKVQCDFDMLTLVIRNLVSNSVKFSSSGGDIMICSSEEDGEAIISVIDNGVGISPTFIEHFNGTELQGLESTPGTAKEKGTGLGLILCKTFARHMNGRIVAAAKPGGNGSVFRIILPHA